MAEAKSSFMAKSKPYLVMAFVALLMIVLTLALVTKPSADGQTRVIKGNFVKDKEAAKA